MRLLLSPPACGTVEGLLLVKGLSATIIIAESFTRIMGLTAGNVHRCRRFLQYNFMDPGWGGAEFPTGGRPSPASPPAALKV